MNPIVFAIPVFLITILAEWGIAKRQGRDVYSLPDAIGSLSMGLLSQIVGLFTKVASLAVYAAIYDHGAITHWPMDNVFVWIVALLLYDFLYYWNHRMGHEVSLLWGAHSIHHSSEYYNLSTALRQSSSGVLLSWLFYIPMAILGVPPEMLVVVGLIDLLYQYWVHTELIGRLGWLDRVFVTPSNHRVHHGQNDYCIDKNYGGILVIWDRLFGTFAPERSDEKVIYGIRKPLQSLNPLWANTLHYFDIWQHIRHAADWRAKLKTVWGSPRLFSGDSQAKFNSAEFVRYSPQTPQRMVIYASAQYALLVPAFLYFLVIFDRMNTHQAAFYGLWLGLSLQAITGLLQHKKWAPWLEIMRWVAGLGAMVLALQIGFGT